MRTEGQNFKLCDRVNTNYSQRCIIRFLTLDYFDVSNDTIIECKLLVFISNNMQYGTSLFFNV